MIGRTSWQPGENQSRTEAYRRRRDPQSRPPAPIKRSGQAPISLEMPVGDDEGLEFDQRPRGDVDVASGFAGELPTRSAIGIT